jgi:hypothetical protein
MKPLKLRKKAAFEMSITTIVILVIAMTMLILGMIMVRKMMCGTMGIMEDVTTGTRNEINKLFNTQQGEVICLGEGDKIQDVFPTGNVQKAYCGFKVGAPKDFTITVNINGVTTLTGSALTPTMVKGWLTSAVPSGGKIHANAGTDLISPIVYLNIPKDASEGFFTIPFTVNGESRAMSFNIKRTGAVQSAIC